MLFNPYSILLPFLFLMNVVVFVVPYSPQRTFPRVTHISSPTEITSIYTRASVRSIKRRSTKSGSTIKTTELISAERDTLILKHSKDIQKPLEEVSFCVGQSNALASLRRWSVQGVGQPVPSNTQKFPPHPPPPLPQQSYGLFDNLPLSYIVPPTPNKVPLYNACKSTSFPTALLAQTGYEVLAFILEPSISFPSSCTVVGGCAVIANVDKMDCQRIECTAGEAIMGSEEWGTPMFIDPMLFTADKPLLDEGAFDCGARSLH
jgi:hypothetical protein